MSIFFSIVLPVYKEEKNILIKCIESIKSQTFINFELIIIIDNPNFQHFDLIDIYANDFFNCKIISNEENLGVTKSLNIGIKAAKGLYIVRQDADDYSLKDRLFNAYNILNLNKEVLIYTTPAIANGKLKPNFIVRKYFVQEILKFKNVLFHGALIIKRDLILENPYNEEYRFSQDYELYNRLIKKGYKIFYDNNNITYLSTPSINSISNKNFKEQTILFNQIVDSNGYMWTRSRWVKFLRLDLLIVLYKICNQKLLKINK